MLNRRYLVDFVSNGRKGLKGKMLWVSEGKFVVVRNKKVKKLKMQTPESKAVDLSKLTETVVPEIRMKPFQLRQPQRRKRSRFPRKEIVLPMELSNPIPKVTA